MNNRTRGHNFERLLASIFRNIGWLHCKTTRQTSRLLDNCKIDLSGIPFLVQAKKVQANINYADIFNDMEQNLKINDLGDYNELPKIIFHSKGKKKYDSLVIMPQQDFEALLIKCYENLKNDRIIK